MRVFQRNPERSAWRSSFVLIIATGLVPATAPAAILWQDPRAYHVKEEVRELLRGGGVTRDDSASGTLYFKFRVEPRSDTLLEATTQQQYLAGLVLRQGNVDRIGLGNALNAYGYSAFAASFNYPPDNLPGELTLFTNKPESGSGRPYLAARRGNSETFVMRIDYVPGGLDTVTIWLSPDLSSGANEGGQAKGIVTRFKLDVSCDSIGLVHHGIGDGWIFDQLAIATRFEDFVPVPWWRKASLLGLGALGLMGVVVAALIGFERRRARRQLAVLEREQAVSAERVRIAQDLHDDLGAKVTEIVLLGELAKGATDEHPLLEMIDGLRQLHASLDEAVWSINPRNDSLVDLVEFVSASAQRLLQHAPVEFHLDVAGEMPPAELSARKRHNLALAVKEALHNAVRHAEAKTIRLTFRHEAPDLFVTISDDGRGFSGAEGSGDGLRNMKARLESIGGSTEIRSALGEGTRVTFQLPLGG